MHLLYSTSDLGEAKRLAAMLDEAGVATHVAGEHVASTPGIHRTPSSVGVWLLRDQDQPRARAVMASRGFRPPPKDGTARRRHRNPLLLMLALAAVLAAVGVVFSPAP